MLTLLSKADFITEHSLFVLMMPIKHYSAVLLLLVCEITFVEICINACILCVANLQALQLETPLQSHKKPRSIEGIR